MKVMVDIPFEAIGLARMALDKCTNKCRIQPNARFQMLDSSNEIVFDTLVCNPAMGGEQTGIGAEHCQNCVPSKKES